jgi:NTE family protein
MSMPELEPVPDKQRALVFQGGGSLGAYEAGAYRKIYDFLTEQDKVSGKEGKHIFDIIAGTSIGAMNAAVLVSYVTEKGTYEGSAEWLIDFWNYLSKESATEANPYFKPWWDYWHTVNRYTASGEAARRYYSSKEFGVFGVPTVFYPFTPAIDIKFYDPYNIWFKFDKEPLKRSLERFAKFPIATNYEDNQPRLILMTVDVTEGMPVTFDSYSREDGHRKTEYGRHITRDGKDTGFEYVIQYDDGISSDHVMASASVPINYDYAKIEVSRYDPGANGPNMYRTETRYFWDGGIMTNTPFSRMIKLHRDYWKKVKGRRDRVPNLGIAVINVHPTRQEEIPTDHDGVINRDTDIRFSDRSQKDEEILLLISDYIDLADHLRRIARDSGAEEKVITDLLDSRTANHGMFFEPRTYRDILEPRCIIDEIIRIERKNDENTISNKTYDFSVGTIRQLVEDGLSDAHYELSGLLNKK